MADAKEFAVKAHGDQKYGDESYLVHLEEVAQIVLTTPLGPRGTRQRIFLRDVAYLHDILEDTGVTESDLRKNFHQDTADAVILLSDPPGPNRRARKAALYERMGALKPEPLVSWTALVVKAADRLANLRTCLQSGDLRIDMYLKEHPAFFKAVYRPNLAEPLWDEIRDCIRQGAKTCT